MHSSRDPRLTVPTIRANALQLYQTHAQANGDFGDPPTWQFLTGSRWNNFDDSVSAQLELGFATTSQKYVSLIFLNAEDPDDAPTVNLERMRLLGAGGDEIWIRRSHTKDRSDWVFEDDNSGLTPVDPFMSSTLNTFVASGRERVRIGEYNITRAAGQQMTQTNIYTNQTRCLKPIQSAPSSPVDDDDEDDTVYDSDEEDNAPDSYKCPISRLIMRRPVQLSDGHSYEKKEIKKWLKRSNKSPCTGDILENTTMTDNFTLRSIIQDDMQKKRRLNSSLATSSNLSGDNPVA